jgi:agmatine deiminase
MPAEWEPHRATWLSWIHNEESWPGKLDAAREAYVSMVVALARSEPVHINVNDAEMEESARATLTAAGAPDGITFHRFPTDDAWCRDHGAIFVTKRGDEGRAERLAAIEWVYNAWGEKYPHELDRRVAGQMIEALGVPHYRGEMILEGGSIDVNGRGLLLTTEACLLNPNRNPHLSRAAIESRLSRFLGVDQVLWLGAGVVGDDTDGHVDDVARFVSPDTVLAVVEEDPQDENYEPLQDNLARLREMRDRAGNPLEIVTLPMPAPVEFAGRRLPASYANFYVANRAVLLPTYGDDHDRRAQECLAALFPDRQVVSIDCRDLVWGLGAFHCLTQQIPL